MKKLLLTAVLAASCLLANAQTETSLGTALRKFDITKDEFTGINYIMPKDVRNFYAYITFKDNKFKTWIHMEYAFSEWLFFNKVSLLIDGELFEYNAGETKRTVDNRLDIVEEKSDVPMPTEILRKIANAKIVKMRLTGSEGQRDYTFSTNNYGHDDFKSFREVVYVIDVNNEAVKKENPFN